MDQKKNTYLTQIFPFLLWINKLKNPRILKMDIISGITVALVLIPQSMAYAWLAGLPIEVWLYTSFVPIIIASLFWSSHQMSTGPVTIVSLMTATALAPIAVAWSWAYIAYASLLAFFIWIFYLLLGNLKLWVIVDFLSHQVILWFTNAVALITIISQLPKLFWITIEKGGTFFETLYSIIITATDSTHLITLAFWVWSILTLMILSRIWPKLPKILILLVLSITFSYFIGYYENFWWSIVLNIPSGLPDISTPIFNNYTNLLNFEVLSKLWLYAMVIGLIWFTESISVAKFVWYKTKQRVSANKELIWQWLANISSSLFGGYGVAWSFSKTAVNLRWWAKTWFSSVVSGVVVIITLLYLTPLLYHLPIATLAWIVIFAVFSLIKLWPIIKAWHIEKHDAIIAIITFIFTISFSPNLEKAIFIWAALSLSLYIYRTMRPKITEVSRYKDWELRDVELFWLKTNKKISVIRFDGTLYFANASYLEWEVLDLISKKEKLKILIIDLTWMNSIDSTWQEVLESLVENLDKLWIEVYICWARAKVTEKFIKIWFIKKFWDGKVFSNVDETLEDINEKYWKNEFKTKHLKSYVKNKKKEPTLEDKVIKNIK